MAYRVEVRYSPMYELMTSLQAYFDRPMQKIIDLGPAWVRNLTARLPVGFAELIKPLEKEGFPFELEEISPYRDDPQAFLQWLQETPVGELIERILALPGDPAKLPADVGAVRDLTVQTHLIWYERYFKDLDPRILDGLEREARARSELVQGLPPAEAVALTTGGIVLEVGDEVERVTLIPQYHARPLNMFAWPPGRCVIGYPVDVLPPAPGAIPGDLRILTRALADDSRLQILRFLANGISSFTDIVKFTGLAKSTVHHHMVTLRSSGLVKVHVRPEGADRYSLRPEAIDRLAPRLHAFLKEG